MSTDVTCMDDFDPDSLRMEQALKRILDSVTPLLSVESVPLLNAVGRTLGKDVTADIDVPGFRNSAMDGYAIRHADSTDTATFNIVGSSLAGHPYDGTLKHAECVRITTGAEVPADADTVVMQENTERDQNVLSIIKLPEMGSFVRARGSNIAAESTLLRSGTRIGAAELGVLASIGKASVPVLRKLKVACFSTGDELVAPGEALGPGKIHDSNRYMLMGLLQSPNIDILDLGVQADTREALQRCIRDAAAADVVISSGGVSVGDADYVREVLAEQGQVNLWKIAMKPGRPLTFATLASGAHYFGLPGNPVSGIVTFHQFVLPALRRILGHTLDPTWEQPARLMGTLTKMPGRVELQRGVLTRDAEGHWQVETTGAQDSHVLTSVQRANCYIVLDLDSSGASDGSVVTTLPMQNFHQPL